MEAANRGRLGGERRNIGLNISLPFEQNDNPYITRRLSLEFHYFFMRKFWFDARQGDRRDAEARLR